jgi:hypothetical protein
MEITIIMPAVVVQVFTMLLQDQVVLEVVAEDREQLLQHQQLD